MELKLEVWDSPNSAGIVIDAVRLCKLALNKGIGGSLDGPSSYLMKSPPEQVPDPVAHDLTEEFIARATRCEKVERGRRQGQEAGEGQETSRRRRPLA